VETPLKENQPMFNIIQIEIKKNLLGCAFPQSLKPEKEFAPSGRRPPSSRQTYARPVVLAKNPSRRREVLRPAK